MNKEKFFRSLVIISLTMYIITLVFVLVLKTIMADSLIQSFEFLNTFTLKGRFIRGIKLVEFYKTEYILGIIKRTVILEILNILIFIPLGVLLYPLFKKKRIIKGVLIGFIISLSFEIFQLYTIIGSFMLSDLISNTIGCLIGCLLCMLLLKTNKYNLFNTLLSIFIISLMIFNIIQVGKFVNSIDIYKYILENRG